MAAIAGILEYGKTLKKVYKSFFDILKNVTLKVEELMSGVINTLFLGGNDFQTYPLKN